MAQEQQNSVTPTLEEIWGITKQAGSSTGDPASSLSPASTAPPATTDQTSLESIWQKPQEPTLEQVTSPSVLPQEKKDEGFLGDVKATAAAFAEGFAFGVDLFDADEQGTHPWVTGGARVLGEVTRMVGEMALSGGIVTALRGIPWIVRAISKGGTAVRYVTRLLPALGRVVEKGKPLLSFAARESAEGLVYTGIEQVFAPEERKPGIEGAVMNVAQFAGGGIGFRAATRITEKVIPHAHPVLKRIIGFSGDTVGGSLAAYGLYEDKSQILTDAFAAETIAIGAIDIITYAMSKGRLNPTPEALHALEKAREAQAMYDFTNSPADEAALWEALNEAIEASVPENAGFTFERDLIENISKDWLRDVEAQRNPEKSQEVPQSQEAPSESTPEPVAGTITGESITSLFNYDRSRSAEIDTQLDLLRHFGEQAGFEIDQLAALAKIESDFQDTGNRRSSAEGPLQVTETALLDLALKRIDPRMDVSTPEGKAEALQRLNDELGIDVSTLEGRVQAGVEYLKVLRDYYGFEGDDLIAAYFSGPTYVSKYGITDEVQYDQISNREYVERYKEALGAIRRTPIELPQGSQPTPEGPPPTPEPVTPPQAPSPTPMEPPTPTPANSRSVFLGNTGRRSIVFLDPDDASLFDFSARWRNQGKEAKRGPKYSIDAVAQFRKDLAQRLGISEEEVVERATQLRERALEQARQAEAGATVYVESSKPQATPESTPPEEPTEPPPAEEAAAATDPLEAADSAAPVEPSTPATDPRNLRTIFTNENSQVFLRFEGTPDALLYDYAGRLRAERKSPTHEWQLGYAREHLRTLLGLSDEADIDALATEYRRRLREKAETLEPEQVLAVPAVRPPAGGTARFTRGPIASPERPSQETPAKDPEARPVRDPNIDRIWDITVSVEKESLGYRQTPAPDTGVERAPMEYRDTSQATEEFQKQIEAFGKWLLEHPGEVTPERLKELREVIKPSAGFSINTTRFDSSGAALESIKKIADIVHDPSVQPLREVEGKARKLLKADADAMVDQLGLLKQDAELLAEVMQRAPETVTALRGVIMANGAELMERAQRLAAAGPDNVTDLEAAQFMHLLQLQHSLTGTLKTLWRQTARTLGSGRIVVGDRMVDLSELDLRDLVASTDANTKVSGGVEAIGGKAAIVKKAKELTEAKSLADLNQRVRKVADDKVWMRAFVEQRSSGLLTNLRTAVTNMASQMLHTFTEHTVNFTAAAMAVPARLVGRGKGRMTFSEATARLIGEITGMVEAFRRPVVRIPDALGIEHARKLPSILDILSMMIHDPLHLATNLENALRQTSLTSRLDVEGLRENAATSAKLKNTRAGKALSRIMDILGFPLRVATLGKLRSSDIMWGFFDQAAAAQRLLGYGVMELADRPFTYGGYYSELAGQIHRRRKNGENVDGLFEQILARRREKLLTQQIETEALASGLSGKALQEKRREIRDRITGGVLKDLDEAALQRIDEIDESALEHARFMTFKDEIETPLGRSIEGVINRHPSLRVFLPFYHTPFRILEKAAAMTPGVAYTPGFLSKTKDDLRGINGKRAQELAYARWAVGTSLYLVGVSLALSNLVTPTAENEGERRRMEEAGLPEHAIRIGDKWIDINKLDPAPAFFFTTMANVVKIVRNIDDNTTAEEIASGAFTTIIRSIADKTWLTSLRQFLDALYGIGSENYLANLLDSAVPFRGLRTMAETWPLMGLNPFYRDYMMEFNGFLERYKPTRTALDTFGKERETYEHFLGFRYSEPSKSPIRQELVRLGLTLPRLERVVNHVELTDDQYWQLRRYLETEVKAEDRLNDLVRSPMYQRASTERKKEMILSVWTKAKDQARGLIRRDPEYQKAYREYVSSVLQKRQNTNYELPDFFGNL